MGEELGWAGKDVADQAAAVTWQAVRSEDDSLEC